MGWVYVAVLGGLALGAIIFYPLGVQHGVMRCMENQKMNDYKQMFYQTMMEDDDEENDDEKK